ncbi:PKD domain-containing protein [Modestobacter lapidis]
MAGLLTVGVIAFGVAAPGTAAADTRPDAGTPATVSADALGTVQVNGVVWSMVTVGNTVYATGSFTNARPAGAPAGTQTTPRANLVAFDIRTGELVTGFDHTLNGQGRTITASPDGTRIYVGGDFTTVDGVARGHVAAFDVATGALVPGFAPTLNRAVYSLTATDSLVYAGGNFTSAGGQSRTRLAAFDAGNGSVTPWAPTANNTVRGMVIDPTGTRVVFGGQFDQVNGATAIALASVDLSGGNMDTWDYGITNAGDNGGVYSLKTDGVNAYANVYGFAVGNIEGTVALNPTNLDLVWMNDCHGDPYDTFTTGGIVYQAGHAHDCETSGNFPDPNPRTWKRAIAMTVETTGLLKATTDVPRYGSWEGRPHPSVLNWWPTIPTGNVTGQYQGSWSVTGGGDYVVYGGEFNSVNGGAQQGLVRFANPAIAPNKRGPESSAGEMRPNATSTVAGQVTVRWQSSWDMDNENLTYRVFRGNETTAVHTVTAKSQWWDRPLLGFTDTRPGGSTATYRVEVSDPHGNKVTSSASGAVTVAAETSAYADRVLTDGPSQYWRLGETSGATAYDHVGTTNLTEGAGISRGTAGAVTGDAAVTADGTAAGLAATSATLSTSGTAFSVEAWVRTASTAGGVIAQYGESLAADNVANTDRALYVDAAGQVSFGLSARGADRATRYTTVRSAAPVNDGEWHHLVATVGEGGTTLYVDGAQVATDATMTRANTRVGPAYWMVGSGTLAGVPDAPASSSLAGAIDEVAVYPATLTAEQVAAHHAAANEVAPPPVNVAPTAAFTAAASGLDVTVDGASSADPDGTVAAHSWNWGDGSPAATGATATHTYAEAGTYTVELTVTDDDGTTATTEQEVTVTAPPTGVLASDAFDRTVAGGLGAADVGGSWTVAAGGSRQSVTSGVAELSLPRSGNNTGSYLADVSSTSADIRTSFSLSSMPTGAGTYVYVNGRRVGAGDEYKVRVRVLADGQVALALERLSGGAEAWPGGEVFVPGLTYTPGSTLNMRVQVSGEGTTEITGKVWAGDAEPADPQLVRTDTTAGLQVAGSVGLAAYRPGSATEATAVRFDAVSVAAVMATEPEPPVEEPPVEEPPVEEPPVEEPPAEAGQLARDAFDRTVTDGLGVADVGGEWSVTAGASRQSVTSGVAELALPRSGNNTGSYLAGVASTSTDIRTSFALSAMPDGNGTYVYVNGRRVGAGDEYKVRVRVLADGQVALAFERLSGGAEAWPGGEVFVPGLTYTAGDTLNVRVQVSGEGTTEITGKVWTGDAEPADPQLVRTDTTEGLQAPGAVGLSAYRPSSVTTANVVRIGGFTVAEVAAGEEPPVEEPPVEEPPVEEPPVEEPPVEEPQVEEPPAEQPPAEEGQLARDAFDRTVTDGLGVADVGGEWSVAAGASRQSVTSGVAELALPRTGNNTGSYLAGVSSSNTDVRTSFSLSEMPTGAGTYVYVSGRRVSDGNEYRVRVRVLADGQVALTLSRLADGAEAWPGGELIVPGLTYTAGGTLNVRVQVSGEGTTEITGKVWTGDAEPADPQLVRTDTTAGLQAAGGVGLAAYRPGSNTVATAVRFTAFDVRTGA